MLLQPDTQLGPYRVISLLGEGGMGEVYRAHDTRLGREVAIKILTAVVSRDPEQLQRFAQEARAAGMLNHPNLITIFDIATARGMPFIVSELLEGETLRDRLLRGPLPTRRVIEYALHMASGLAAAHEKGIVHRDLKPENVFITRDDRVKILDFGIAKLNLPGGGEGSTFKMAATEPGMVLGTVGYMSPEQVRGDDIDQRSDIFAFGAIVYEMLSGARAFKRDSAIETLSAILKEEPPELSLINANIPLPLEKFVARCLEKERARRFQSARDLAFTLETLAHTTGGAGVVSSAERVALEGTDRLPTDRRPLPPPRSTPQARPATAAGTAQPVRMPLSPHPMKKPRRVSPWLIATLFIVSVLGAAFGAYRYALSRAGSAGEASFHRLTFRRGEVRSARFSSDGETIVYSAAWEGKPLELYVANRRSPEARTLGVQDAEIASISKNAELALLLRRDRQTGLGTLARLPIAGGIPREIANDVVQADWAPNGDDLAIIRRVGGEFRVEYPLGKVLYRTVHPLREIRVSPSGQRLAFIEPRAGAYDIVVITNGQPDALAHGFSRGAVGLAWRPDEKEVWVTGTDTSAPPALYGLSFDGELRPITRLTGSMRLYDVATNGAVLMMHTTWRATLSYQAPGEPVERDASWFDWSIVSDLSSDGRTLLFNETREGGGSAGSIYVRRADAATPVRIGDGFGDALSPDGTWVITHQSGKLVLLPTGAGEPRPLNVAGAFDLGAAWMPDGRSVVVAGAPPGEKYGLFAIDISTQAMKKLAPDLWGEAFRPFAISPDGSVVAAMSSAQRATLYPVAGGAATPVNGVEAGEVPVTFSADGTGLYVARQTGIPVRVFRITLSTGVRELWKEFVPPDAAGVYRMAPIVMTRDASAYAYVTLRNLSDLFVVDGLH